MKDSFEIKQKDRKQITKIDRFQIKQKDRKHIL